MASEVGRLVRGTPRRGEGAAPRLSVRLLASFLVLASSGLALADESGLAFPGAAGWGRFAKGARASSSPTVYHVTNLNDSGTGSLRDAVSRSNRIVVFDVSGVIRISSRITFASNLYVAGQTAPGEGITVYGNGCSFSGASNIICRYLRWRMGHGGSSGKDCAGIANGQNMIFDHCSFSWGLDETFSINPDGKGSGPDNITLQNCIFGQGLLTHSAGGLMQADYVTLYRNFYCDNSTRNNKMKGRIEYANNIVYNWKNGCVIMGGDSTGSSYCNIEGNLFVNGPSGGGNALGGGNSDFHFYGNDNWQDSNRDGAFNPSCIDSTQTGGGDKVSTRYAYSDLELWPGNELLELSLPMVGASLPYRDLADCYMVDEAKSCGASGALITYETSLPIGAPTSWPWWSGAARTDTDGDGMPDDWESANGTNPNSNDATAVAANGYLNIENYINSITAEDRQFFLRRPMLPSAADSSTTTITLEWRDYTYGEESFIVEKSPRGAGAWSVAGSVGADSTSCVIHGLPSGTYFDFRIRAVAQHNGATVYSEYSDVVVAATSPVEAGIVDVDSYQPDVTYKNGMGDWNFTNTGWVEAKAFRNGYKVLLGHGGNGTKAIAVTEAVEPESVVVNGSGWFQLDGNGNLGGSASLNKAGSGYLYLNGDNTYTGATVNHGGTITFNSLKNGGVASPIGASQAFAQNWIFDGGTYRYAGKDNASTDRSALLKRSSTFEIKSATVTMSGAIEGTGDFTLAGGGTLSIANSSFFAYDGATILRGSTIYLSDIENSAKTFKPSKLVLAGGGLSFAYRNEDSQTHKFPIYVTEDTTSYLSLPSHGNFQCPMYGTGSVQMNIAYQREYIDSNLTEFEGQIIANSTGSPAIFMSSNPWNAPKTRFYLSGSTYMSTWRKTAPNYLGGLSGDSGTRLIGCTKEDRSARCSWVVGSADSDEEFAGVINDLPAGLNSSYSGKTSITKVGVGDWKLTGNNTYSGTTTVDGGRLLVCGIHSGTGEVTVNAGGTLRGTGKIAGPVTVKSGGVVNPGDDNTSNSLTANGSTKFESGSTLKIGRSALYANGAVTIDSGATLEIDTAEKSLGAGTEIQVFKGAFNINGTFSAIEPSSPGEDLAWDTSTLYTDGKIEVYSSVPVMTYFIGGNGSYWDQTSSWDNGIPADGVTAVFTNATTLTVNMGWNSNACICDEIQLNGADVVFQPKIYWPRLSPKSVTGTGAMHLLAATNKDSSGTTSVGLVSQGASDMFVEVPVFVESTTASDQDVFFQGLNGHTINFYRPVTIGQSARLIAYDGTHFRGGFAVESTKWNSLRGTNTIACDLTGGGNLHLEVDAGITYFTGDSSGFTGTITQELYSNVPRFIGGASAPANGTVNVNGDMFIVPNEYGETFRFGALNLTRSTWFFCYVMKNMGVRIEVGSKGDSFWEDGYSFGTWDGTTASTTETTDAEIVKVGEGTTLAAYAQQYDNSKVTVKEGYCIHPRWSQDFENAETYAAQFSGGTVASTAFGTSESSYELKGTVGQAERTIYGTETTSKFFRIYTTAKNDTDGAVFTMPAKVSGATEGYRVEFDYFLSQNIVASDNDSTGDCSGLVVAGSDGTMMTILGRAGKNNAERANAGAFKGDSVSDDDKIATVRSWGRGTDPASASAQAYWNHYTIIGVPSGSRKGVYLSIKRVNGDTTDDVISYKLSDDYSTVQAINLLSIENSNNYGRYICLDNVVASIAETGKPYIANDDNAVLSGDEDSGYVLTASEGLTNVVVRIPSGVSPQDVTVRVQVAAETVEANGASVRVLRENADITDYLSLPVGSGGVVRVGDATVKEQYVREVLDPSAGADFGVLPDGPRIVTAPTRVGLVYTLREGETLESMAECTTGDSEVGDGQPWVPEISVRGGPSGFYSISVGK